MGLIYADLEISNPANGHHEPVVARAMVDTGAVNLCIPATLAADLGLEEIEKRRVTTADETTHDVPYVGPVRVKFQNRTCFTGALVIGNSVLMGAVPMEDMDLVVSPSRETITVNPDSPDIPSAVVK